MTLKPFFVSAGCVLAIVGLLASTAAAQGKTLTFKKRAPAVGDVRHEQINSEMNMLLSVDMGAGEPREQKAFMEEVEVAKTEVLGVDKGVISKARVTFGKKYAVKTDPGGEAERVESPVADKIFVIAKDGDQIVVTNDKTQAAASAVEAAEVKAALKDFGRSDPLQELLPDGPMTVGQSVKIDSKKLLEVINAPMSQVKVQEATLTLKKAMKVKGVPVGVFDANLIMNTPIAPGITLRIALKGEFVVEASSKRALSLDFKAPVTLEKAGQEAGPIKMTGGGLLKVLIVRHYKK